MLLLRQWNRRALSSSKPLVTQHRSNKLWLETPVNLNQAADEEVSLLHQNLVNRPPLSPCISRGEQIEEISRQAFATARSKLESAPNAQLSQAELEEVRGLIAMAVFHDNDEAKLFAAGLLLSGAWPATGTTSQKKEEEEELTARQRGMRVIKEIRKMQKANRLGYSRVPPKDPEMAAQLLRTIATPQFKAQAMLDLGDLYFFPEEEEGTKAVVSKEEALQAYETACSLQQPGAHYRLACAKLDVGDESAALEHFKLAANLENDADAHLYLAHHYKTGGENAKARQYLDVACNQLDNSDAMTYLARWEMELGNEFEAVQLLVRAAKQDNAEAMHLLADAHVDGSLGLDVDLPRAITLYCKSGEVGRNAQAWMSAGALALQVFAEDQYEFVFQCYTNATECCSEGGEVHDEAWRRLAHLYLAGKGVERNEETGNRILKLIGDA
ncbi:hypothetical protein BASA81_004497 [Batrachochytrium salamandrivorans]|nr:hypothetical protein BASA81_004497 [Batrachochytrium salamandrivorans]